VAAFHAAGRKNAAKQRGKDGKHTKEHVEVANVPTLPRFDPSAAVAQHAVLAPEAASGPLGANFHSDVWVTGDLLSASDAQIVAEAVKDMIVEFQVRYKIGTVFAHSSTN